jgi:hypothetical protein
MAMSGAEIYRNFHDGAGPDGLLASAMIVNEIASEYVEEATAIQKLTAKMESAWHGDAAGAANRGAGPLATEHESAGSALLSAQALASIEADVFALSKNSVVPVPPKPTAPDPWTAFVAPGEQVAFEDQVDDYNAAAKHNVAVMTDYASNASDNARQLPLRYGTLSDDGAGIEVGSDTVIEADDPGRDTSGGETDGRRAQDAAIERRPVPGDEAPGAAVVGDRPDSTGSPTSPGAHTAAQSVPVPSGAEPGGPRPVAAPGAGTGSTPGLLGVPGFSPSGGPRGSVGMPSGGVSGIVPRDGAQPRAGCRTRALFAALRRRVRHGRRPR